MGAGFWLGLLLALPIAVLANIATRPLQNLLDRWSNAAPVRRTERVKKRLKRAQRIRERPYTTAALISSLLFLIFTSVSGLVYAGIALHDSGVDMNSWFPWQSAASAQQRLSIVGSVVFFYLMLLSSIGASLLFLNLCRALKDADDIEAMQQALAQPNDAGSHEKEEEEEEI